MRPGKKTRAKPEAPRILRKEWSRTAADLTNATRSAPPSVPFEPQLAKLGELPPAGDRWLHEIKWDGYRILATVVSGRARLWSRNAIEWTHRFPGIQRAIEALGLDSAALDGELIAGSGSKEDFNLLQATLSGQAEGRLAYVLFDLLHLDGVSIAASPLAERKALLQALLANPPHPLAFSSHIEGDGADAYRLAGEREFEGIISKRMDRPYQGGRSEDWRKTKQLASDEFAVVGYTAPKGSRAGFGSLLLAKPDPVYGWRYVGRVGSGFSDTLLQEVTKRVNRGGVKAPTVHVPANDTDLRSATWFEPRFVVEVFYRGIGRQQLLRQPSLKAVRVDKDIADLADSDRARPTQRGNKGIPALTKKNPTNAPARKRRSKAAPKLTALTSPDKVLFPAGKITKQQVWDYYLAVANHLMPEILGRPLSVIRCPSGIAEPCFFQKHLTSGLDQVSTVKLKEESGTNADYLVVESLAGLMELVQFNALEFHPWGSHANAPDVADRVVFDLDPGPGVTFADIKRAATDIRTRLADLGLESFLRVSGGKGLHVVVPLNPGCKWDLTKRFARGFADALAGSEPDRYVATSTKSKRNKRIFIDYLRNGRGATAVASYSMRARRGAPVALPIAWAALPKLTSADQFTIQQVPALLRRRRKDPWAGMRDVKQNLARWAE